MWTAKQIWEAGKASLDAAAAKNAAPPAPAPDPVADAADPATAFELTALGALQLEDRPYRVHFRGGTSGEYDGYTLRSSAPFPLSEVVSIDPV
jgi:hypothetical protein